jgi:hypothetical protein
MKAQNMVKCNDCRYWNPRYEECGYNLHMTLNPVKERECKTFEPKLSEGKKV